MARVSSASLASCRVRISSGLTRSGGVSTTDRIQPPVLSAAFGNVGQSGAAQVTRSGYIFQMFLPGAGGTFVAENANGGGGGQSVDGALSEILWACYAWPISYGNSGKRAFFVNQAGDVLATNNTGTGGGTQYSGSGATPATAGAGFLSAGNMNGTVAANVSGADGNRWVVSQ